MYLENLTQGIRDKAFPNNIASTPLVEFKLRDDQYKNLAEDKNRCYLFRAYKKYVTGTWLNNCDKKYRSLIIESFISQEVNVKEYS